MQVTCNPKRLRWLLNKRLGIAPGACIDLERMLASKGAPLAHDPRAHSLGRCVAAAAHGAHLLRQQPADVRTLWLLAALAGTRSVAGLRICCCVQALGKHIAQLASQSPDTQCFCVAQRLR